MARQPPPPPRAPAQSSPGLGEAIRPDRLRQLYLVEDFAQLGQELFDGLAYFEDNVYRFLLPEGQLLVDRFVEIFLTAMADPDFSLPPPLLGPFINLNHIVSNLVAVSAFRTTDAHLEIILRQPANFFKILTLYSVRNRLVLDPKSFFDVNPAAASLWYFAYFDAAGGYADETIHRNIRRHVTQLDDRLLLPDHRALSSYFMVTYIDDRRQADLKRRINELVRRQTAAVAARNRSDGRTIAVITGKWEDHSAVYRCYARAIEKLAERHRLVLIHAGKERDDLATAHFSAVRRIAIDGLRLDLREVLDNDFALIFYPDVGMNFETLYTANMRLAPIQVTAYGHPASTCGAQIDYFVGGAELEDPAQAEANYSERLVLIPGLGQPTVPPPAFKASAKPSRRDGERVIVNCAWSQDKTTPPLLACLKAILARAKRPVLFRLYPNHGIFMYNRFIPYERQIREYLGEANVELPGAIHQEYWELLQTGQVGLDSWPFNGYNTIVDSLRAGIPLVTLEGEKCYERVGGALLRRVGLPELIAANVEEYVALAVRLIDDEAYRQELAGRIGTGLERIYSSVDGDNFADAIDYLLEHHNRLQAENSRRPIDLTSICRLAEGGKP